MFASVCRVCLSSNNRMERIQDVKLLEIYEKLSTYEVMTDRRNVEICYICYAQLKRCRGFYDMSQDSDKILRDLSDSGMEVTLDRIIKLDLGTKLNLSIVSFSPISYDGSDDDSEKVFQKSEFAEELKEETTRPDIEVADMLNVDIQEDEASNDTELYCQQCKKTFANKKTLDRHMKIHTGEQSFACNSCPKTFSSNNHLQQHMKIHSRVKPATCNKCGKMFPDKSHLQEHKKAHSGEKPYFCDRCGKSFSSSSNLHQHMKVHGAENTFVSSSVMPPAHLAEQRAKIITLHEQNHGQREIARLLNISRTTVRLWIERHISEGTLSDRRRHNHRPSLITNEQRTEMQNHLQEHPSTPAKDFAAKFKVGVRTIKRNLHRIGLHNRLNSKKVTLTDTQKTTRLNFARSYLNFDWSNVIFTGEKTFSWSERGHLRIMPYKNRKDHTGFVIHLWGWMSANGVGDIIQIPPINSFNYSQLLGQTMLPSVRNVYPNNQLQYVYEITSAHEASTNDWFASNLDVSPIPWPSNSPDLNPIENLWGIIVQMWENRNEKGQNMGPMEDHCKIAWDYMRGTDICSRLVDSMPSRLRAVIEANGDYTRL